MHESDGTKEATVLVVDDERDIAELYSAWLVSDHEVRTATSGADALECLDDSVDVVFLDRQMPGMTGDEVLDAIDRRSVECSVVMVTAVDPDFDIVEMPFDEYLTKPVSRGELLDTVTEMLARTTYDERIQQYFAMVSKKATLETEKSSVELQASDEYRAVSERVRELREETDAVVEEINDFESVFQEFPGSGVS
ncbi:HalX domain-containing protein [Haloarcula salina]|uniref:HalX domain-containing protein n=1 Tax=Haloarcula salina TaxID=1429914 RepID=UPI003C6F0E21